MVELNVGKGDETIDYWRFEFYVRALMKVGTSAGNVPFSFSPKFAGECVLFELGSERAN